MPNKKAKELPEFDIAWDKYERMFGEKPPIFGYNDDDILPAIKKALKTRTPMPGMHEIIEKELGMTEQDKADGKGIIL